MDDNTTLIEAATPDYIELTADVVSAYVSSNNVPPKDLPALFASVHATLTGLSQPAVPAEPAVEKASPAQVRKSITHEALISFIDGKGYKTLKRHLFKHKLDSARYRERYGLPSDYPTIAPGYSEARSKLAFARGLGRERVNPEPASAPAAEAPAEKPKRAERPRKAEG